MSKKQTPTSPRPFFTWTDDGNYRQHKSFAAAGRFARNTARPGKKIEITDVFHHVATVRVDALDRVWTDVVDGFYA